MLTAFVTSTRDVNAATFNNTYVPRLEDAVDEEQTQVISFAPIWKQKHSVKESSQQTIPIEFSNKETQNIISELKQVGQPSYMLYSIDVGMADD